VPTATIIQPNCSSITGTINIVSPLGASMEYSIDGITWQNSGIFSGLNAGMIYTIRVRNSAVDPTCVSMADFTVNSAPILPQAAAGTDRTICLTESTQIGGPLVAGSSYKLDICSCRVYFKPRQSYCKSSGNNHLYRC